MMIPMTAITVGECFQITRIGGSSDFRRHLESLGFVIGSVVMVVAHTACDLIVNIRGSRVALGRGIACKVFGCPCALQEVCRI